MQFLACFVALPSSQSGLLAGLSKLFDVALAVIGRVSVCAREWRNSLRG